jgi:hypothetical protein
VVIADRRLHELLIRAELEDCKMLDKDESPYLAYWDVVRVPPEAATRNAPITDDRETSGQLR